LKFFLLFWVYFFQRKIKAYQAPRKPKRVKEIGWGIDF